MILDWIQTPNQNSVKKHREEILGNLNMNCMLTNIILSLLTSWGVMPVWGLCTKMSLYLGDIGRCICIVTVSTTSNSSVEMI